MRNVWRDLVIWAWVSRKLRRWVNKLVLVHSKACDLVEKSSVCLVVFRVEVISESFFSISFWYYRWFIFASSYVAIGYDKLTWVVDCESLSRVELRFDGKVGDAIEREYSLNVMLFAQSLKRYLEPLVLGQARFEWGRSGAAPFEAVAAVCHELSVKQPAAVAYAKLLSLL